MIIYVRGGSRACVWLAERRTPLGGGCATYSSSNTKTRNAGLADESGRGTDYGIQRFPKSKSKSEKNEVASSFPDRGRLTPGKE